MLADIFIFYHERFLLANRHYIGVAVYRLILARGLEDEAIVPFVCLEVGSKSFLSRRRGIRIRAEAVVSIFNALESYEYSSTIRLCFSKFRTNFLVELNMNTLF